MKGHFGYRVPLNTKSDHRAFLHRFRFTLDREWLYLPSSLAHKAHDSSTAPIGINFQGSLCGPGRSTQPFFHEELHRRLVHCCPSPEIQGWPGEARAHVCSAAVPHEAVGGGEAACGSYGVVRRRRAEAQHGASGIKHAVNISKIVEAIDTLRDQWTRVQKLIQNGTSGSACDE